MVALVYLPLFLHYCCRPICYILNTNESLKRVLTLCWLYMYVLFFTLLQQFPLENLITEIIVTCFETAAFIIYYLCIGFGEINAPRNEMTHSGSQKMCVQVKIKIQAVDLHCIYCAIASFSSLSSFSFKPHPSYTFSWKIPLCCFCCQTVISIQPTISEKWLDCLSEFLLPLHWDSQDREKVGLLGKKRGNGREPMRKSLRNHSGDGVTMRCAAAAPVSLFSNLHR